MPVEERLRSAFADIAAEVRPDVEERLVAVRRRSNRRRAAFVGGLMTALVVVAVGLSLLLPAGLAGLSPDGPPTRQPAGPATSERVSRPGETVPLGTYVRQLSADQAVSAGFPRGEVRRLFGGGDSGRVEMVFRKDTDGAGGENGWVVWFVDATGERQARDGGTFYYDDSGALVTFSKYIETQGLTTHYDWNVEGHQLTLTAMPGTQINPVVELLQGGAWLREPR
jgi:hypothetical protein